MEEKDFNEIAKYFTSALNNLKEMPYHIDNSNTSEASFMLGVATECIFIGLKELRKTLGISDE